MMSTGTMGGMMTGASWFMGLIGILIPILLILTIAALLKYLFRG